jgi:hypothetical protein
LQALADPTLPRYGTDFWPVVDKATTHEDNCQWQKLRKKTSNQDLATQTIRRLHNEEIKTTLAHFVQRV